MYLAANEAGGLLWRALAAGATRESLARDARGRVRASTGARPGRHRRVPRALQERGLLAALMRRLPDIHDARAGWWTWRALRTVRRQLARRRRSRRPSPGPARRTASGDARRAPACSDVSTRRAWNARWSYNAGCPAQGIARDVIVGTQGARSRRFTAHAWIDGEPQPEDRHYIELIRLSP